MGCANFGYKLGTWCGKQCISTSNNLQALLTWRFWFLVLESELQTWSHTCKQTGMCKLIYRVIRSAGNVSQMYIYVATHCVYYSTENILNDRYKFMPRPFGRLYEAHTGCRGTYCLAWVLVSPNPYNRGSEYKVSTTHWATIATFIEKTSGWNKLELSFHMWYRNLPQSLPHQNSLLSTSILCHLSNIKCVFQMKINGVWPVWGSHTLEYEIK